MAANRPILDGSDLRPQHHRRERKLDHAGDEHSLPGGGKVGHGLGVAWRVNGTAVHSLISPSAFIQRTLVRNASSVRPASFGPCDAETSPPGAPMMSTPFASMAMRRRWLRLGLRTAFNSLNPNCSGSNVSGSIFNPFGFWKMRNADASP